MLFGYTCGIILWLPLGLKYKEIKGQWILVSIVQSSLWWNSCIQDAIYFRCSRHHDGIWRVWPDALMKDCYSVMPLFQCKCSILQRFIGWCNYLITSMLYWVQGFREYFSIADCCLDCVNSDINQAGLATVISCSNHFIYQRQSVHSHKSILCEKFQNKSYYVLSFIIWHLFHKLKAQTHFLRSASSSALRWGFDIS